MKKTLSIILGVIVIVIAFIAVYRFSLRKYIPEVPVSDQVTAILQNNDCFVCHSQTPKMPFYASFPVIGPMMDVHVDHAVRFIDLETKLADMDNVDEVTLAMLEHCIAYKTMPIAQYKMIHWGTTFNKKENDILSSWILASRKGEPAITPVPACIEVDQAKAALGEKMYNDTNISLDNTISCASCHVLKEGGVSSPDNRTSEGIYGQFGGVNAPTVYNAVFNVQQFWNGRAADLREQAAGPPANPVEMGDQTWDQIVARLKKDKALVKEFEALYPGEGLTEYTVTSAIAEFEKTLLTPDCAFDKYLKGDKAAMSAEEIAGYESFNRLACATCHTGVILGGKSFEELGIYADYFAERDASIAYCADDDGLKGFTGKEGDLHKFKVPGLRNVALTAPYFHDGSVTTMEDAVRLMAKYELGKELSEAEVNNIVAFMKALTGVNPYLN